MVAVRAAGSVTLLAGALVLAGALATAQRRRIKQAVILKTLGATRRRILTSHLLEYSILALVTSAIALVVGSLAAWITVCARHGLRLHASPGASRGRGHAAGDSPWSPCSAATAPGACCKAPSVPYLRSE